MELLRSKTRRCWAFWRAWFCRLSSSGSYYRARILIGPDAYSSVAELLEVRPIEILNSDASVRRAKGSTRPVNPEQDLISQILPDVLVKVKDWAHYLSGRDIVEANGGRVVLAKMVEGRSTTATIERMRGG